MAWIEQHRRADGGLTARVIWRPGGARGATRVWETFGAGSDAQNLARADGFKRMVEAAGQRWPDGWVKGEGFVRPPDVADPMTPPPSFDKIGKEYVRQIVDLSPGQRKRYLGQLQLLARTPVDGDRHHNKRLDRPAAGQCTEVGTDRRLDPASVSPAVRCVRRHRRNKELRRPREREVALPQRTAGKEHSGTGLISHYPKGRHRRKGPQTGSPRAVAADPRTPRLPTRASPCGPLKVPLRTTGSRSAIAHPTSVAMITTLSLSCAWFPLKAQRLVVC
jgi:hypothetical protein